MIATREVDVLMVGQGLAGSLLALELLERGLEVVVVDDRHRTASSRAAAGLINPVTGQRLVKAPGTEASLAAAQRRYGDLQRSWGRQLLFPAPMYRLFRSPKEREAFGTRLADPAYAGYLQASEGASAPAGVHAPLGGFRQHHTGYLDTLALLTQTRRRLADAGRLIEAPFEPAALQLSPGTLHWRHIAARRLIFCEGYRLRDNPWFDWLPLQPAKGEILAVRLSPPGPEVIVNAGKWLMPRADGSYRAGATYDRERLDEAVTAEGAGEILAALAALLPGHHIEVTGQAAGVRPGTRDKRPFLGFHPEAPRLGVFNGFGSKGSLLIPWHAARLAEALCDGAPLPPEVDIRRHWPG